MKILSSKEEKSLSKEELIEYYQNLRKILINTPHDNLTKGSLTICPAISSLVRFALKKGCGYDIIIDGADKIKGLTGIYAHTHQSKYDHVNLIASNPNHTIILNSSVLSSLYKLILSINGVVYVDKNSKESRNDAKTQIMRLLLQNKSITIFPESAWNLSPNKLHLPLYLGFVDIAKKTGKPIIPVVQNYTYDTSKYDGIERIKSVYISYCNPIFVKEEDDPFEKMEEYSEIVATTKWNFMENQGIQRRSEIDNYEYINFLKGCIRNLQGAGIDINVERDGIFGANDDFYLFHHLNAVDYDEKGNLLPTEHVRKLEKLYNKNCTR